MCRPSIVCRLALMSLMFARPAQWVELFGMLFLFKMRSFLCTLLLCNKMIREVWGGEGAIPIKKFEMDALKWHILVHLRRAIINIKKLAIARYKTRFADVHCVSKSANFGEL